MLCRADKAWGHYRKGKDRQRQLTIFPYLLVFVQFINDGIENFRGVFNNLVILMGGKRMRASPPLGKRTWTAEEENYLRESWGTVTVDGTCCSI